MNQMQQLLELDRAAEAALGALADVRRQIAASLRRGKVSDRRLSEIKEYFGEVAANALSDAE